MDFLKNLQDKNKNSFIRSITCILSEIFETRVSEGNLFEDRNLDTFNLLCYLNAS